jgi:hypothetical protein
MEHALQRYTNDFLERSHERSFPDISFSFPDSAAEKSLDGADIVAAHRHIIIAASPYMRNTIGTSFILDYAYMLSLLTTWLHSIDMMADFGLASATEGNSRENPWPLHGIDQHGFAIAIDFMYHPRFLNVPDKELDSTLSPTSARAVFVAAQLLCLPLLQAMCFKVLAAQLTPMNCLGALQLCLDAKEQWP